MDYFEYRNGSLHCEDVPVADIAAGAGTPVICIPGQAAADAPKEMFTAVHPLVADEVTVRVAVQQPKSLLRRRAAEAVPEFIGTT